jgi:hypothetical protein
MRRARPKPTCWVVIAKCEGGHSQEITTRRMSERWVRAWAGLMDGTSPLYGARLRPESLIGKCGICGSRIVCSIRQIKKNLPSVRSVVKAPSEEQLRYVLQGLECRRQEIEAATKRLRAEIDARFERRVPGR